MLPNPIQPVCQPNPSLFQDGVVWGGAVQVQLDRRFVLGDDDLDSVCHPITGVVLMPPVSKRKIQPAVRVKVI